jgi:NitT/TauT family transport system substrate-binding protein
MMITKRICFLLLALIVWVSQLTAADTNLKKVSFIPHWLCQAQFAGYYVAFEKGFYSKRGIDLTIQEGGPRNSSATAMEKGTADFASLWLPNAIQLRLRGVPVVNIAQLMQRSALMLVTKKSSGIATPKDMNGKKVGVWGGDFKIQVIEFLQEYNLNVRIIEQPFSINLFLVGGIDVTSAMWYNEYDIILNSGINADELNTFFFADHNLNFPEEGIYCRASLLEKDPELCRAFVEATLEGWMYAFQHQDEAIDIVINYSKAAKISVNRTHQRWMLARMQDLLLPQGSKTIFTHLSEAGYQLVVDKLIENEFIHKKLQFSEISRPVIK